MAKFKGWDFIELADHWGLDYEDVEDEYELIREYIYSKMTFDYSASEQRKAEMKQIADDIREYLKSLSKYETHDKPVWEGLLKVKDDFTFLRFCADLLHHMWI
ncbi:hypothetical protein H1164_08170 [Thermoactinomyces daqus]|uniref:Uncharacterized protein n=1 Tax=Thermoactinomyces daqus TaxID=1329516 RepID=A0A7W1XA19_9BACL|nr:hypothetical protein [Thermoactinomyces daqus]MBA4542875.1 hypothetical protein [Thermoactinomyces daqus]